MAPRIHGHYSRWLPLLASACLVLVGLLAPFSVWLDHGLGLIALAVGSSGLVVAVGTLLIQRAVPVEPIHEQETRAEAIWGWLKAAIVGVIVIAALAADMPLTYVLLLVGVVALIATAVDVILGVRSARRADAHSGRRVPP